jgi:predicted metalloprotease
VHHAATTPGPTGKPLLSAITGDDLSRALDVIAGIGGDDILQYPEDGMIQQNTFVNGTPQQREKWFMTGYRTGDPNECDTFNAKSL